MSDSAERLARLTPEQRARLVARLRSRDEGPRLEPRPRPADPTAFPLSHAQAGLWFAQRLNPDSSAFNSALALRLRGELDEQALRTALDALADRHEILRSRFPEVDGTPVQLAAAGGSIPLRRLTPGPDAIAEEYRCPFDLARGPVARASVLELGPGDSLLLLVAHHIACDAWSKAILRRDLAAFLNGDELPRLPLQFADYAAWQRERLQGALLDELLAWWSDRLAGLVAFELPLDKRRPPKLSPAGTVHRFALPAALSEGLRVRARDVGATPFMVLLAGFLALLHRSTGCRDIAVGTDVANRGRRELEAVAGCFINQVVIRCEVAAEATVEELVSHVRDVVQGALAHQELPFERLLEHLRVRRSPSRNPLFQVGFRMADEPDVPGARGPDGGGVEISGWPGLAPALVDLAVEMSDGGAGFRGEVVYNADLFAAGSVQALTDRYERVLAALVARPGGRVRELLGDAEPAHPAGETVVLGGVRVDPRETEAALREHPQVADAIALVGDDDRLGAWVVPLDPSLDEAALRTFLATRLEDALLPAAIRLVAALPVDPEALRAATEAAVRPPTRVERELTAIWCELLELEEVGARDDFFELGGDSLLAAQVVARVRRRWGVDLRLPAMFENPTIDRLAGVVQAWLQEDEA